MEHVNRDIHQHNASRTPECEQFDTLFDTTFNHEVGVYEWQKRIFSLGNEYTVELAGWYGSSEYARGRFVSSGGTATAAVTGAPTYNILGEITGSAPLVVGNVYAYQLYQYCDPYWGHVCGGDQTQSVNGQEMTVTLDDEDDPSAEGTAVADANGKIEFTFHSGSDGTNVAHNHLSGMKITTCVSAQAPLRARTPAPTPHPRPGGASKGGGGGGGGRRA